jgi:hypothetical protein
MLAISNPMKGQTILKQCGRTTHNILWCQQHAIPNAIPIIQNASMRQARGFRHTRRARRELNIRNLIRIQPLIFQRSSLSPIFQHILIPAHAPVFRDIYPSIRIVHQHNVLQRRYELRFELRAGKVRYEVCEERDVGARVFSGEVRFRADDEVRGGEVVEGGENLWRVEGWVQWYLYLRRQLSLVPRG